MKGYNRSNPDSTILVVVLTTLFCEEVIHPTNMQIGTCNGKLDDPRFLDEECPFKNMFSIGE